VQKITPDCIVMALLCPRQEVQFVNRWSRMMVRGKVEVRNPALAIIVLVPQGLSI